MQVSAHFPGALFGDADKNKNMSAGGRSEMLIASLVAFASLAWVTYEVAVAVPMDEQGLGRPQPARQAVSERDSAPAKAVWSPAT